METCVSNTNKAILPTTTSAQKKESIVNTFLAEIEAKNLADFDNSEHCPPASLYLNSLIKEISRPFPQTAIQTVKEIIEHIPPITQKANNPPQPTQAKFYQSMQKDLIDCVFESTMCLILSGLSTNSNKDNLLQALKLLPLLCSQSHGATLSTLSPRGERFFEDIKSRGVFSKVNLKDYRTLEELVKNTPPDDYGLINEKQVGIQVFFYLLKNFPIKDSQEPLSYDIEKSLSRLITDPPPPEDILKKDIALCFRYLFDFHYQHSGNSSFVAQVIKNSLPDSVTQNINVFLETIKDYIQALPQSTKVSAMPQLPSIILSRSSTSLLLEQMVARAREKKSLSEIRSLYSTLTLTRQLYPNCTAQDSFSFAKSSLDTLIPPYWPAKASSSDNEMLFINPPTKEDKAQKIISNQYNNVFLNTCFNLLSLSDKDSITCANAKDVEVMDREIITQCIKTAQESIKQMQTLFIKNASAKNSNFLSFLTPVCESYLLKDSVSYTVSEKKENTFKI